MSQQETWDDRLSKNPQELDTDERNRIENLASNWRTCAVGEALGLTPPELATDSDIGEIVTGISPNLVDLGNQFMEKVIEHNWAQAKEIYEKIRLMCAPGNSSIRNQVKIEYVKF